MRIGSQADELRPADAVVELVPHHPANIKWGLLYGVLLCNGRAIGEFGAVAVVRDTLSG